MHFRPPKLTDGPTLWCNTDTSNTRVHIHAHVTILLSKNFRQDKKRSIATMKAAAPRPLLCNRSSDNGVHYHYAIFTTPTIDPPRRCYTAIAPRVKIQRRSAPSRFWASTAARTAAAVLPLPYRCCGSAVDRRPSVCDQSRRGCNFYCRLTAPFARMPPQVEYAQIARGRHLCHRALPGMDHPHPTPSTLIRRNI